MDDPDLRKLDSELVCFPESGPEEPEVDITLSSVDDAVLRFAD